MGWSGSNFVRVGGSTTWADDRDAQVEILASLHDTNDEDLATGIDACLNKNGANAATANISMGNNKLTNLAAPSAGGDAVNKTYADAVGPFGGAVAGDEFLARLTTTPTGWAVSSVDDKAIKIVSGTPGADGGNNAFSVVLNTAFNITGGSHSHGNGTLQVTVPQAATISGSAGTAFAAPGTYNVSGSTQTTTTHTHSPNFDIDYREFNIFTKQ